MRNTCGKKAMWRLALREEVTSERMQQLLNRRRRDHGVEFFGKRTTTASDPGSRIQASCLRGDQKSGSESSPTQATFRRMEMWLWKRCRSGGEIFHRGGAEIFIASCNAVGSWEACPPEGSTIGFTTSLATSSPGTLVYLVLCSEHEHHESLQSRSLVA